MMNEIAEPGSVQKSNCMLAAAGVLGFRLPRWVTPDRA
jgi:hypothetical protein